MSDQPPSAVLSRCCRYHTCYPFYSTTFLTKVQSFQPQDTPYTLHQQHHGIQNIHALRSSIFPQRPPDSLVAHHEHL